MSKESIRKLFQLADGHKNRGELQDEIAAYKAVLALDDRNVEALTRFAELSVVLKMNDTALGLYQILLTLKPSVKVRLAHLSLLTQMGKNEEAEILFRKMEGKFKNDIDFLTAYGSFLLNARKLEKAIRVYKRVLKLSGPNKAAYNGIALALNFQRKAASAIPFFRKAMALDPSDRTLHVNASNALFSAGNMEEGWKYFESRLHPDFPDAPIWDHPWPVWRGESLAGKTILISIEQGVGDQILFASCIQEVIAQADHVILEVTNKLVELFRKTFPEATVHPGEMRKKYEGTLSRVRISYEWLDEVGREPDYVCAIVSSYAVLRPNLKSFSIQPPFLYVDLAKSQEIRQQLEAQQIPNSSLVGLCWRSTVRSGVRTANYNTAEEYAEWIAAIKTPTTFVNLQYRVEEEELNVLINAAETHGHKLLNMPEIDLFDDLLGNAALIRSLDYALIGTGTTQRVMASALGIPVFCDHNSAGYLNFGYKGLNVGQPTVVHLGDDMLERIDAVLSGQQSFVEMAMERFVKSGDFDEIKENFGVADIEEWQQIYQQAFAEGSLALARQKKD